MSRSDNTDWHRKRDGSNQIPWRDVTDWNTWRTDFGNAGRQKDWWQDYSFPAHRGQELRRLYWKTERSRVRQHISNMDPWLDDDPAPTRTRYSVKYDYW